MVAGYAGEDCVYVVVVVSSMAIGKEGETCGDVSGVGGCGK